MDGDESDILLAIFCLQVAEGLPIADWSQVEWNNTGKTVYEHMKGLYRLFLEMQFGGERIAMTGG